MHDIFDTDQRLDKAFQFAKQFSLHLSQCEFLNGGWRRSPMAASPENLGHLPDINFCDTATCNQIDSPVQSNQGEHWRKIFHVHNVLDHIGQVSDKMIRRCRNERDLNSVDRVAF